MATEVIRYKGEHVNCYLLVNGKDAVLVDTGMQEDLAGIVEMCKPYNVRLIALTHGHGDHTFNASELSKILDSPIAINEMDVELMEDSEAQAMAADTEEGFALLEMTKMNKGPAPKFKPSVFLKEGDTLDEYGIPAKVIGFPGHTKGSIGFDVEERDLLVGDALFNNIKPVLAIIYNDKQKSIESGKKIKELGKRNLYFGHGNPLFNTDYD